MKVDLTAAVAVYNSSPITWLALEALCRQETNRTWEVIVMEDPAELFCGEAYFDEFRDRLAAAGCKSFRYVKLDSWVPLGLKWKKIAAMSHGARIMFTDSDDYSSKDRIEVTCDRMPDPIKWFDVRTGLFYDIPTGESASFIAGPKSTGLMKASRPSLIARLKGPAPKQGVDNWMFRGLQVTVKEKVTLQEPMASVFTDGANTISKGRRAKYIDGVPESVKSIGWSAFVSAKQSVSEILPQPVLARLEDMRGET